VIVTITEAHNRLSYWLKKIPERPITITHRGRPVAVLVAPDEYDRLRQVAYLDMLRLSHSLQDVQVTAEELFETSRAALEARP
jgi:prevent-host-death family protein